MLGKNLGKNASNYLKFANSHAAVICRYLLLFQHIQRLSKWTGRSEFRLKILRSEMTVRVRFPPPTNSFCGAGILPVAHHGLEGHGASCVDPRALRLGSRPGTPCGGSPSGSLCPMRSGQKLRLGYLSSLCIFLPVQAGRRHSTGRQISACADQPAKLLRTLVPVR